LLLAALFYFFEISESLKKPRFATTSREVSSVLEKVKTGKRQRQHPAPSNNTQTQN